MGMAVALDRTRGAEVHVVEEGLVRRAQAGDCDAFRRLVEPFLPAALGSAAVITRSSPDGADAVQDALLLAWRSLPSLRDPDAFGAWFRRLVVRSAVRVASRRGRFVVLDALAEGIAAPPGELDLELDRRRVRGALDRLDANDRAILTMRYLWDLSGRETAASLGVPEGTVRSRLHNALRRLRAAYDAEDRR